MSVVRSGRLTARLAFGVTRCMSVRTATSGAATTIGRLSVGSVTRLSWAATLPTRSPSTDKRHDRAGAVRRRRGGGFCGRHQAGPVSVEPTGLRFFDRRASLRGYQRMISQHNVEHGVIADAKLGCAKCIKDRIVKASHSLGNVVGCEDALVDSQKSDRSCTNRCRSPDRL